MARWTRTLGATAAVASAATLGALAVGAVTWRRSTAARVERLLRATGADECTSGTEADLPAPVARYFAYALPPGTPGIRTARIRWAGEFRMRPGGGWSTFEAEQHFGTSPPGFVWDARIRMLPLVDVRVRDGYLAGEGTMLGRVGGVLTVVDQGGTAEMAAGALLRWLGEAAWFPTALLPHADADGGVRWETIDDSTARATIADAGVSVSAEFHFAPTGAIERMTAMRFRDVNGSGVRTPFEGRYREYERRNGLMIPTSAEVAWLLPEGRFAYWRGRPIEIEYERASGGSSVATTTR